MYANITKIQIFDDMKFDLIITLTYVHMDNFCPFLYIRLSFHKVKTKSQFNEEPILKFKT